MPNMANIVVKKADGTTDITYTGLSPSAGDNTPAQWRVESIGTIAGNRPVLKVSSKYTADHKARIINVKLVYPETYTDANSGLVMTRLRTSDSYTRIFPLDASDTVIQESMAQFANLLKSTLIQDVGKTGFAPS